MKTSCVDRSHTFDERLKDEYTSKNFIGRFEWTQSSNTAKLLFTEMERPEAFQSQIRGATILSAKAKPGTVPEHLWGVLVNKLFSLVDRAS